jgi:transketolase
MLKTPGLDTTSGSLGNGLSVGVGMALGGRLDKLDYRVFVLLGDGELQEGVVWEAAMAAGNYGLQNLVAVIDRNRLQNDDRMENIMEVDPIRSKFEAFRWRVLETDGHSMRDILDTFDRVRETHGRPTAVVAHTVKGKGVSFMEDKVEWHGLAPDDAQLARALRELEGGPTLG